MKEVLKECNLGKEGFMYEFGVRETRAKFSNGTDS